MGFVVYSNEDYLYDYFFLAGFQGKQWSRFQRTEAAFSLEMIAAEQHASKIHSAAQRH